MYANMLSQLIEEKEEGLGKLLRSSDQQDVNETFVSLLKALGKKNLKNVTIILKKVQSIINNCVSKVP